MPNAIGQLPSGVFRGDACSRCNRADNCYDTDIEIEYEGGLALCAGCIGDLAVAAGYDIQNAELVATKAALAEALEAAVAAKSTLAKVKAALR